MAETARRVRPPNTGQPPPPTHAYSPAASEISLASSQRTQTPLQPQNAIPSHVQPSRYSQLTQTSRSAYREESYDDDEPAYSAQLPSKSHSRSYTPSEASLDDSRPSSRASSRAPSRSQSRTRPTHSRQGSTNSVDGPAGLSKVSALRAARKDRESQELDDRSVYSRPSITSRPPTRPSRDTQESYSRSRSTQQDSTYSQADSYRMSGSALSTTSGGTRDQDYGYPGSAVTTSSRGAGDVPAQRAAKSSQRSRSREQSDGRDQRAPRSSSRVGTRSTSRSVSRRRRQDSVPESAISRTTDGTQDPRIPRPEYDDRSVPASAVSRSTDGTQDTQIRRSPYDDRSYPASAISRNAQTPGPAYRNRDLPGSAVSSATGSTQMTQVQRSEYQDRSYPASAVSGPPQSVDPRVGRASRPTYDESNYTRPSVPVMRTADPRDMNTPRTPYDRREFSSPATPQETDRARNTTSTRAGYRRPDPQPSMSIDVSTPAPRASQPSSPADLPASGVPGKVMQGLRRKQVPRAVSTTSANTDTRDSIPTESPRKTSVISEDVFENASVQSGVSPTSVFEMSPHPSRAPVTLGNDLIGRHLLLDTAMNDSQDFQIMSMDEVDEHKAKLKKLNTKIFQERRKLAMEMKVQNAAQNLYRLYENSVSPKTARKKNRHAMSILVDTKKTPELGHLEATKDEEMKTERKIHELQQFINGMTSDKAIREGSLLRHNAAVLLAAYGDEIEHKKNGLEDTDATLVNHNLMDELLPPQSERFTVLQGRLEALNTHITAAITRYRLTRGEPPEDLTAKPIEDDAAQTTDIALRVSRQVALLERNIFTLDHECSPSKINEDIDEALRSIATRTESSLNDLGRQVDEPLPLKRVDTRTLVSHLDKKISKLEDAARATPSSFNEHKQAYDAVADKLRRVWDTQALGTGRVGQDFDLNVFDNAVIQKIQLLNQRNAILQEQLRQQREVPAQANEEHERVLAELQSTHAELQEMHTDLQLRHETAQAQNKAMRQDGDNVMSELERLKNVADSTAELKQKAIDECAAQKSRIHELESELVEYQQALEEQRQAPVKLQEEMSAMHKKLVQLTTELAESKAEADRAHGSRAERAKEAVLTPEIQAQLDRLSGVEEEKLAMAREMDDLKAQVARRQMLEHELSDMASEHQELTRETVQVEKEREQLEGLVDSLKERCGSLESELEDEKANNLGAGGATTEGTRASVSTSTAMLRAEFKKMIRATRAESDRKLKAEQEERRRLETQLRELRREKMAAFSKT